MTMILFKILRAIYGEIRAVPAILRCVFARIFVAEKTILIRGWIHTNRGTVKPNNWGDDINISFFAEATGKRILPLPGTRIARMLGLKNFVLIGSVISSAPIKKSIIWGSGLINDKRNFTFPRDAVPAKILAVRGPLTRKWLLAQGIDCPAVFGDPALILPKFYSPKKLPRARVGLIPHHSDLENENGNAKRLAATAGTRLIRVQNYNNWRDFIDEICASDFVISASLHGLIVAQAYGVPALWVEFCEHIPGWDFKFHDFYESIGKFNVQAVKITDGTTLEELLAHKKNCTLGSIDLQPLLNACPFELHKISQR